MPKNSIPLWVEFFMFIDPYYVREFTWFAVDLANCIAPYSIISDYLIYLLVGH
ncbi:MAG: hypothetical protein RMX68_010820 [Aulosira sp. ZfuVER01]|nr:hypothetical protein [Aulosira sp. DedVER01a]MDZ8053831.1 hypothetical protein [Aulosira sp. ZfuCHP01]